MGKKLHGMHFIKLLFDLSRVLLWFEKVPGNVCKIAIFKKTSTKGKLHCGKL